MTMSAPSPEASQKVRSVVADVNYLARHCDKPSLNNGDFTKNVFPSEPVAVEILDAETFAVPPSLDTEGFCRVQHEYDIAGLADSPAAAVPYRESLAALIKKVSGADEVCMMGHSLVRRQAASKITKDIESSLPADFVHSDSTDKGAAEGERFFYPPPSRPGLRRTAAVNLWKLLSSSPTPYPLAVCDARSLGAEDITPGPAYFPSIDGTIDTAFFHPNGRFRWIYFSKLTSHEILLFKQYDSDARYPTRVPHTAFKDPSCPSNAEPRISIESRCLLRWYN